MGKFSSFAQFYPVYLSEHARPATRRLHFLGSSLALLCLLVFIGSGDPAWFGGALIAGYGFAWASHLLVEKNRPATFRHPIYSFMGDWLMFWQMLSGKL